MRGKKWSDLHFFYMHRYVTRWYNSETLLWNWTQNGAHSVEGLKVPESYQVIPHSKEEGLNLGRMGGMVKNVTTYALKNLRKNLKMDFHRV